MRFALFFIPLHPVMANSFQSFSRRLSRRIILIVLVMMVLMGVGMVTWTMRLLENLTESHYQVVMEDASRRAGGVGL